MVPPDAVDGFWRALDTAIAGVAAEGPTITVTTYTVTMLQKVTRRLAVELMVFNLRDPAILRRYAEWVVEMLTTPARKLTPAQMARLRYQRARARQRPVLVELKAQGGPAAEQNNDGRIAVDANG